MVRTKVFVGNLSFKTTEGDLTKEFEVAGKVAAASIITRGSRSLGYGFVEFDSEEEAKKSVELLNKKQIDSREINVEVARPRDENAVRAPRPPRGPRAPRQGNNNNGNNNAGGQGQGQGGQGEGALRQGGQGGGRGRGRFQRRPRGGARPQGAQGGEGGAPNNNQGGAPRRPRGPPRGPRPAGEQRERPPRAASANTLFVANLPFSVDDAGLSEIFAGLNIKGAHVVRKRNNRSKGFGFVEFNNTDDQTKALAAVDKKTVQDRELIVKVALTEVPQANAGAAAPAGEQKDAAAATTPKKEGAAAVAPAGASGSPKPQQQQNVAAAPAATGSPKPNQS